jgi:hypothetical protein
VRVASGPDKAGAWPAPSDGGGPGKHDASGPEITLPPIYIDADPTDDMEITIDPVIINNNPTD